MRDIIRAVFIPGLLIALVLFAITSESYGGTPKITVPPTFTAPQEQASQLADPANLESAQDDDRANDADAPQNKLVTVVTVVQCNVVIGVLAVDARGEVHPAHFQKKTDVQAIQRSVPADHNFALNVGCPGRPAKDTTVL